MLVRFISFIITVFGTKRYQPIVVAGFALIISFAGLSAVLSVYNQAPRGTAASTVNKTEDATKDTLPSQTPGKQDTRQESSSLSGDNTSATPAEPANSAPAGSNTPGASSTSTTELTIRGDGNDTLNLKVNETSAPLTFTISDTSTVQWSASTDTSNNGLIVTQNPADKNTLRSSTSFTVKALTAGTYTLAIHAKDSTRGVDVAKIITLIITAN
jgi:hypothetical protein